MDHWGKGGFLSQEDSKHHKGSADGPFLTSQVKLPPILLETCSHPVSADPVWTLKLRCSKPACQLSFTRNPKFLLYFKKLYQSQSTVQFSLVGECMLSQHEHWDDDHSSSYGRLQKSSKAPPWHWLTLSALSGFPCQMTPWHHYIFISSKPSRVAWKVFLFHHAVKLKATNMTKSSRECEGINVEPLGNHLLEICGWKVVVKFVRRCS